MTVKQPISGTLHRLIGMSLFTLLILGALGWGLWLLRAGAAERGVAFGPPPEIHHSEAIRGLGVNIDLVGRSAEEMAAILNEVKGAGLGWVRHSFLWAEIEPEQGKYNWTPWDEIVSACAEQELPLVAVLHTAPAWAQAENDRGLVYAPPRVPSDFGRFCAAFAERYASVLDHYQIWDEPNIQPHWGHALIDPTGYMRLLREASIEIRAVDPQSTIILGGLAPTVETGPLNMNESQFLRRLYQAGAAPFFDVVATKPYGFWSGPDDRRAEVSVLNFSRLVLLREAMIAEGDLHTPIWAVEMGWNALPVDWAGNPSPWGTDEEALQAQRTLDAVERARVEWPWLSAMALARFRPPDALDDPRAGFALIDREGEPRMLYRALAALDAEDKTAYPGRYSPDDPVIEYSGRWRVRPQATDVGGPGDRMKVEFYGTRIDLTLHRGRFWGVFYVSVDGKPANGLPRDSEGRSYLVLHDPLQKVVTVTLASGLTDAPHLLDIVAEGGWEQWPIREFIVIRERSHLGQAFSVVGLLLVGTVGLAGAVYHFFRLPWVQWWPDALSKFHSAPPGLQLGLAALFGAVFYVSPYPPLTLSALLCLGLCFVFRPELGLAAVTFVVPYVLQTKQMPGRAVNLVELTLTLAVLAFLMHVLLRWWSGALRISGGDKLAGMSWLTAVLSRVTSMDVAMFLMLPVAILAVLNAENFGVANRELRVVFIEPLTFYLLIRLAGLKQKDLWLLADVLVATALVVALIGLYQFVFTSDVITAEGVRRIKSVYASPNNLSLFLGRSVALLLVLTMSLPTSLRRGLYLMSLIPATACLYLTYSRGAWLLGIPLVVTFLVLVRKGRVLWIGGAFLAAVVCSLIPVASTERVARLLRTDRGTAFLRIKLWQGTLQMIRDHPLWGVGPDNFLYQYRTRYILPEAWQEPNLSHPHNVILDFWTRLGFLGIIVFVWQQLAFFRMGLKAYGRMRDGHERALALALMAMMVYSVGHGLIDNSFFLVDLALLFTWAVALLVRLHELSSDTYEVA